MDHCHTHSDAPAAGTCRACLEQFCDHCLVYSYGRAKPPFCMECALRAAGVRQPAPQRDALA